MKELERTLEIAKDQLRLAQEREERTGEAIDSMNRRYFEGYVEAIKYALRKVGA